MKPELESRISELLDGDPDGGAADRFVAEIESDPPALEEAMALMEQDRMLGVLLADEDRFVRGVIDRLPARRSRALLWAAVAAGLLAGASFLFLRKAPAPTPEVIRQEPRPPAPAPPKPPDPPAPAPSPEPSPPPPPVPAPRPVQPPTPAPRPEPPAPPPVPAPRPEPQPTAPPKQVATPAAPSTFRLGVVDLKVCFDKERHLRIREINSELAGFTDTLRAKIRELESNIDRTRQALEAIDRQHTPKLWEDKKRQLTLFEAQLKFERDAGRARYLDLYGDRMIEVYNEIRRVVTIVAQEERLDLVLRVEPPQLEEQDQEGLSSRINSRVVLHHNPSVDITPLVVKRLNEDYARSRLEWDCRECGRRSKGEACQATPGCKGRKP